MGFVKPLRMNWPEQFHSAAVAAMRAGRIDAASVSEPALDDSLRGDARVLGPVFDAIAKRFLISGALINPRTTGSSSASRRGRRARAQAEGEESQTARRGASRPPSLGAPRCVRGFRAPASRAAPWLPDLGATGEGDLEMVD